MKLLLDTHTLLWFIAGSASLSNDARALIESPANEKFVSIASIWETAIKISIGKMSLSAPFDVLFPHQLQSSGFELLPVKVKHTSIITSLPFHHRDPFDRLLIAQAIEEKLALMSLDEVFDDYGILVYGEKRVNKRAVQQIIAAKRGSRRLSSDNWRGCYIAFRAR